MVMDSKALAGLDRERLRAYIEARLREQNFDPPYHPDRGVEPENCLIDVYEQTPSFKKPFETALAELLEQFVDAKIETDDADFLSRLLFLIEWLNIRSARKTVLRLWAKREQFKNVPSLFTEPDLFVQLAAVAALPTNDASLLGDFKKILLDSKYAPVAYTAIIRMGLDHAIQALPDYIAIAAEDDLVRSALRVMAELYGKGDDDHGAKLVYQAIFQPINSCDPFPERDLIIKLMRDIPAFRRIIDHPPKQKKPLAAQRRPPKPGLWKIAA